jgi:hypothetical protein
MTGRDSCREPGRRGMFHAGTLRRWNIPCHPNRGHDFPDLVAKNGEFRYMVFGIRNNLCLFARIRYKMTSKMIANGRFWMGDCLLDRAVIRENRRNPCFSPSIGVFHRRVPTEILPSIMGMLQVCSGGEIHPDHLPVGDIPPRGSPGLQTKSYSQKTKS